MNQIKTIAKGLRWSPHPVPHYIAEAPRGSHFARHGFELVGSPAVWNLFWISAAGIEEEPLLDIQIKHLLSASRATARQKVADRPVSDSVLMLMPDHFADLLDAHPSDAERLVLRHIIGPNWVWLIRHRAQLFFEARTCDAGHAVLRPELQDKTKGKDSTTIIQLSAYRPPGT